MTPADSLEVLWWLLDDLRHRRVPDEITEAIALRLRDLEGRAGRASDLDVGEALLTLRAILLDFPLAQNRVVDWFANREHAVEFQPGDGDFTHDRGERLWEPFQPTLVTTEGATAAWAEVERVALSLGIDIQSRPARAGRGGNIGDQD